MPSRRSAGIGPPACASTFLRATSNSAFVTVRPFTRAMTSGSTAGIGLGGAGAAAGALAGASEAGLAGSGVPFLHAPDARNGTSRRPTMRTWTLVFTVVLDVWRDDTCLTVDNVR